MINERRLCYTICNIHENHWISLEIDFVQKVVSFYDPFHVDRSEYLKIKFFKKFDVFFDYKRVEGLKQKDGFNCGVYCVYWVVCKMQNRKIDPEFDPNYYR